MKKKIYFPGKKTMLFVLLLWCCQAVSGCKAREESRMLLEEAVLEEAGDGETEPALEVSEEKADMSGDTKPPVCYVHICGAVKNPGVYRMEREERVFEALERAEGFAEDASEDFVNLAEPVADGMKIYIPTREEAAEWGKKGLENGEESRQGISDGLVNINTATEAELCTLPGIGQSRAKAVIAYREDKGKFKAKEDIMKVGGIKEASYGKLKDLITV